MNKTVRLHTPLTDAAVRSLRAGDEVVIDGAVYTARDMAHQRLCALLDRQDDLPIDLHGAVIYFVGPTPAGPGRPIGSAGPTTSSRMDAFSPRLVAAGLKGMIGKGYRSDVVRDALKRYGAIHLSAVGGAGALLSRHIVDSQIVVWEDLGPEAIRRLVLKGFPAIVAYDAHGNSVYEMRSV